MPRQASHLRVGTLSSVEYSGVMKSQCGTVVSPCIIRFMSRWPRRFMTCERTVLPTLPKRKPGICIQRSLTTPSGLWL